MIFLDSNIWLYGYAESGEERKRAIALDLAEVTDVCLSSQVINEVMMNLLRAKLRTEDSAMELVEELYSDYLVMEILQEDILMAGRLRKSYNFSYWDSLIVASGLRANAEILYSEDMQDGLVVFDRLLIRNPFKAG